MSTPHQRRAWSAGTREEAQEHKRQRDQIVILACATQCIILTHTLAPPPYHRAHWQLGGWEASEKTGQEVEVCKDVDGAGLQLVRGWGWKETV